MDKAYGFLWRGGVTRGGRLGGLQEASLHQIVREAGPEVPEEDDRLPAEKAPPKKAPPKSRPKAPRPKADKADDDDTEMLMLGGRM